MNLKIFITSRTNSFNLFVFSGIVGQTNGCSKELLWLNMEHYQLSEQNQKREFYLTAIRRAEIRN